MSGMDKCSTIRGLSELSTDNGCRTVESGIFPARAVFQHAAVRLLLPSCRSKTDAEEPPRGYGHNDATHWGHDDVQ